MFRDDSQGIVLSRVIHHQAAPAMTDALYTRLTPAAALAQTTSESSLPTMSASPDVSVSSSVPELLGTSSLPPDPETERPVASSTRAPPGGAATESEEMAPSPSTLPALETGDMTSANPTEGTVPAAGGDSTSETPAARTETPWLISKLLSTTARTPTSPEATADLADHPAATSDLADHPAATSDLADHPAATSDLADHPAATSDLHTTWTSAISTSLFSTTTVTTSPATHSTTSRTSLAAVKQEPSVLEVGEKELTNSHPRNSSNPLFVMIVSVFTVMVVIIVVVVGFHRYKKRNSRTEFRRLQDLPMDDMMEDTPLSLYSY